MSKLNYRLTSAKSSSLTASTDDPRLGAELFEATEQLVAVAFAKMHLPNVKKEGHVPEIISDVTLAKIEELETTLEFCRNLMIDIDVDDDLADDWTRAIDAAAGALGYLPGDA